MRGRGIWTGRPYNMVIILAGLAGVDRTLYEAAAVDGATTSNGCDTSPARAAPRRWPDLLTLAAIRSLRTFTEVYVLTGAASRVNRSAG